MPINRTVQISVVMPPADITVYSTSGSTNRVVMNRTSAFPYTDSGGGLLFRQDGANILKPDGSQYVYSDVQDGQFNVYQYDGFYTLNISSNTAYGYKSTRGSFILLNGTTVLNNFSKNFTTKSGIAYYDMSTTAVFPTPYVNPNFRMVISAQRGGSGTDNRAAIIYANDALSTVFTYANVAEYFYYYRAVDNASRGSMGGSPANGTLSIEGTYVSSTFTPNPGYYINYINDSAASNIAINSSSPFVHNIASYANRTITCYFGAYTYTVTATCSSGGTISATPSSGNYGFNSSITYAPSYAYELEYLQVDGVNVSSPSSPYTISNVTANKTVYAKYRRISNMQACIGGALKRLDMYACIDGTLKPIITKFCIGGVLKQ